MLSYLLLLTQIPAVTLAPVEGAKLFHKVTYTMNLQGSVLTYNADVNTKYVDVTDKSFTLDRTVSNGTAKYKGKVLPMDETDMALLRVNRDGTLDFKEMETVEVEGVLDVLLFRFIPLPAEKDETVVKTLPGNDAVIPDQKIESTFLGKKEAVGEEGYAFRQKSMAGPMNWTTDFVVRLDGTILEASCEFSGFFFGDKAIDGTGKATMKLIP
ncbi:hypothetical protein EON81_11845 [bacterium]|nr:MAG: hypothetical protein EON81_11845 [bacterium]